MDLQPQTPPERRPRHAPQEPFVGRGSDAAFEALRTITPAWLEEQLGERQFPVFSRDSLDGQAQAGRATMAQLRQHLEAPRQPQRWYLVEDYVLARRLGLLQRVAPYVMPFVPRPCVAAHAALWVGPTRSRSGLHADPDGVNILVMVSGQKRFLLYPPEDTPHLSRSSRYDNGAWASEVDIFAQDAPTRWPGLRCARQHTVILGPGDFLYVPRHWWHAVENLEPTVAISFRGETLATAARNLGVPVAFVLHHLGLFRRGNCTCH